jgi:hypothetical protein
MSLYSCSSGTIPISAVTVAYTLPSESAALTVASSRESWPRSPMRTLAESPSPCPSQVMTRTGSSFHGAPW